MGRMAEKSIISRLLLKRVTEKGPFSQTMIFKTCEIGPFLILSILKLSSAPARAREEKRAAQSQSFHPQSIDSRFASQRQE